MRVKDKTYLFFLLFLLAAHRVVVVALCGSEIDRTFGGWRFKRKTYMSPSSFFESFLVKLNRKKETKTKLRRTERHFATS